ncbi:hypothetical protein E2C01_069729 [Portunus trituberculatus]|uniref:Uncharacterized protein n=1 Tax=Portunus trituberculatus TaxID=210409 RepID=A0A5B7HZC1_PORTR|nr:hypothetical protein [Portunus trituberculatus]
MHGDEGRLLSCASTASFSGFPRSLHNPEAVLPFPTYSYKSCPTSSPCLTPPVLHHQHLPPRRPPGLPAPSKSADKQASIPFTALSILVPRSCLPFGVAGPREGRREGWRLFHHFNCSPPSFPPSLTQYRPSPRLTGKREDHRHHHHHHHLCPVPSPPRPAAFTACIRGTTEVPACAHKTLFKSSQRVHVFRAIPKSSTYSSPTVPALHTGANHRHASTPPGKHDARCEVIGKHQQAPADTVAVPVITSLHTSTSLPRLSIPIPLCLP